MPRGAKVNNPGNIRISLEKFKGEIIPSKDVAFKTFETLEYGYRCMAVILYNYFKLHGCNTLAKIITRYAPPTDGNNTAGYIALVSGRLNMSPDRTITEADFKYPATNPVMQRVIGQMAKIETLQDPNDPALSAGYQMFVNERL